MDTISEKAIIETQMPSALNTEIEKLDKCRFAYVTELGPKDTLNEKTIKQVTGGDPINLRTLHSKDRTINPTSNLWILLNEMIRFNGESKALLDRLIVIPFNANFPKDVEFEDEMFALVDYFFSYIMYTGRIMDKFDLSDEMIAAAQKHVSDNTDNTLANYLSENLVDCVNDKIKNKLLSLNDVRLAFENDCKLNNIKSPVTQRKFPDKVRALGYVIKETCGSNKLYGKRFKNTDDLDDEDLN
jgi:phage/plasmid-associated DNA primase